MYLSYSGFALNEKCPYAYWHRYVARTEPPTYDNRVNMLYGATVGKAFEHLYNEHMWRVPDFVNVLLAKVPELLAKVI